MTKRGLFIVIEGIDGAGTTTQSGMLCKNLEERGIGSFLTREPSAVPVGRLIRDFLEKRITPPREVYGDEFAERDVLSLLFTADRMDHLYREVLPKINTGAHVVSDRYMHSTCAYQMKDSGHLDWILDLHKYALVPDLTIYIDLPPEDALARIRRRQEWGQAENYENSKEQKSDNLQSGKKNKGLPDQPETNFQNSRPDPKSFDLFETSEQLKRIYAAYETINKRLSSRGDRIVTIDGRPDADDIHTEIKHKVESLFDQ
jgi:dTMP kinase